MHSESNGKSYPDCLIILNPVAGMTDPEQVRQALAEQFSSRGISYRLHETRKSEDVTGVVKEARGAGVKKVIASGGDGTVAAVAAGLVNSDIPLGILPTGTANTLARELSIPIQIPAALSVILEMPFVRKLDAMKIGTRYHFLSVGAGVSSLTMDRTRRVDKRRFGIIAYIWRGLELLRRYRPRLFRLIIDGDEYVKHAAEVNIANAGLIGIEPFNWGAEIAPDDGVLNVCAISARAMNDIPRLALDMATGGQESNPDIECFQAHQSVYLDSRPSLPVQADGEIIGRTPVEIKLLPHVLEVISRK